MPSSSLRGRFFRPVLIAGLLTLAFVPVYAQTESAKQPSDKPWMNTSLTPDERADLVVKAMTLDEKLAFVHGTGWGALKAGSPIPEGSNKGAGYVQGIPRLGIPGINMADSAVGIRLAAPESRYATLLPSTLGAACSWDPDAAFLYGSVIGRELREQGFNMSIGGGVDITREPRNGRNFEYAGEDPILAGTMDGNLEKGLLSQKVMNDIKHYTLNDQETGRNIMNAVIDKRAMRESDMLAFQIAIGIATPSAVMCSYNKLNGDYACENDYLLNQVLKKEWGFKGFVVSDWMGTHSAAKAAMAGLDNEEPGPDSPDDEQTPGRDAWFAAPLKKAVQDGQVPMSRLEDMDRRILRSMFAAGVIDDPPFPRSVVDPFRGRDDAQRIAEESIVLLKNAGRLLPLNAGTVKSIALIGSHADVGVLSGGGSAQVDSPGGNAVDPHTGESHWGETVYFPSSPLKEIRTKAPGVKIEFNGGTDTAAAVALARASQVAIVFVNQPMYESHDARTLSLPDNQDALVSAVAAANPRTIVVLETGGPVTMPWADHVAGIVEAWYPGIGGAQALSRILFGEVNPSGKLAVTFAKSDADLPNPTVTGIDLKPHAEPGSADADVLPPFDVHYPEGLRVGYKWFESERKQPLFAFGYGLSYTSYMYSGLKTDAHTHGVTFEVKNSGSAAGTEIAEVYAVLPVKAQEPFKRLIGWQRVTLNPGESKTVTLTIDPLYLSIFNTEKDGFELLPGDYKIFAGPSSMETPLSATMNIAQ